MTTYIILGFYFIWLALISWIIYKARKHYYNLISRSKKQSIDEILDYLLANDKKFSTEIEKLEKEVRAIVERSQVPLQKIGMVRFNPFERVGGEQSFVIALLNNRNSGLVVNFIYTREGLRTYIKIVKSGKGEKYELSDEEKEAIKRSAHY